MLLPNLRSPAAQPAVADSLSNWTQKLLDNRIPNQIQTLLPKSCCTEAGTYWVCPAQLVPLEQSLCIYDMTQISLSLEKYSKYAFGGISIVI